MSTRFSSSRAETRCDSRDTDTGAEEAGVTGSLVGVGKGELDWGSVLAVVVVMGCCDG